MLNNNLKIFVAVAEHGSVSAAARTLFISAPAVSQAVKALKKELDIQLFTRSRQAGMVLTSAGAAILKLAGQMLALEEQMHQQVAQEKGLLCGTLRLASVPALSGPLLAEPIAAFARRYPGLHIDLQEGTPDEVAELLENGLADLAVSASPFGRLQTRTLLEDEMIAISSPDSATSAGFAFDAHPHGLILTRAAAETLREQTDQPVSPDAHCNFVVQDTETVVRLTAAGNGTGLVSRFALDSTGCSLPRCPLVPPLRLKIGLSARDFSALSPAAAAFVRELEQTFPTALF